MNAEKFRDFAFVCFLYLAAAILGVLTLMIISLVIKFGIEYLNWLMIWNFINV